MDFKLYKKLQNLQIFELLLFSSKLTNYNNLNVTTLQQTYSVISTFIKFLQSYEFNRHF